MTKPKLIYRGINSKYKDYPFIPAAMRDSDIAFMENEINEWLENNKSPLRINYYKEKCDHSSYSILSKYSDIVSTKHSCYSYFLSLANASIKLQSNQLIRNFCKYPLFHDSKKVAMGKGNELLDDCIQEANHFFNITDAKTFLRLQNIFYDYALLQHLNYTFPNDNNIFPSMLMDWTFNRDIANSFSKDIENNSDGLIVAIDYSKYKENMYILPSIGNSPGEGEKIIKVLGTTDYLDPDNSNNRNMKDQEGIVIFWSWKYIITELVSNDLGNKLGFEIVKGNL